jgi:hypothetical protein
MIRASRNPDAFLNLIGGLAFRQPRLTHDRFDTVQFRAERIRMTGTGMPERNRRIGRNTLLLQMINPAPASNGLNVGIVTDRRSSYG